MWTLSYKFYFLTIWLIHHEPCPQYFVLRFDLPLNRARKAKIKVRKVTHSWLSFLSSPLSLSVFSHNSWEYLTVFTLSLWLNSLTFSDHIQMQISFQSKYFFSSHLPIEFSAHFPDDWFCPPITFIKTFLLLIFLDIRSCDTDAVKTFSILT